MTIRLEQVTARPNLWHYDEVRAAILGVFDPRREGRDRYRVLEAGGGSASHLPLPNTAEVTTIDISPEQLAANDYATEKLLGDLQTFDYGTRRYNLIIAWDVLEHLDSPQEALCRFVDILEPGGCLVVVGPQRYTLKGLVTRLTPHRLHVWFYRYILGSSTAGEPGHPPFPAHLAAAADPTAIASFVAHRGLSVEHLVGFESSHVGAIASKGPILIGLYRAAESLLHAVTFGKYARGMTDFFLVGRKQSAKN